MLISIIEDALTGARRHAVSVSQRTEFPQLKRFLQFQIFEDAAAALKMLRLRSVEVLEQPPRPDRIVAQTGKMRDDTLLLSNMPRAEGNVPFGFLQMPLEHRAIISQPRERIRALSNSGWVLWKKVPRGTAMMAHGQISEGAAFAGGLSRFLKPGASGKASRTSERLCCGSRRASLAWRPFEYSTTSTMRALAHVPTSKRQT